MPIIFSAIEDCLVQKVAHISHTSAQSRHIKAQSLSFSFIQAAAHSWQAIIQSVQASIQFFIFFMIRHLPPALQKTMPMAAYILLNRGRTCK